LLGKIGKLGKSFYYTMTSCEITGQSFWLLTPQLRGKKPLKIAAMYKYTDQYPKYVTAEGRLLIPCLLGILVDLNPIFH
jgi:hypothetical protein